MSGDQRVKKENEERIRLMGIASRHFIIGMPGCQCLDCQKHRQFCVEMAVESGGADQVVGYCTICGERNFSCGHK